MTSLIYFAESDLPNIDEVLTYSLIIPPIPDSVEDLLILLASRRFTATCLLQAALLAS